MTEAFEDLNFLMASPNRLDVLQAVAARPRDKDELVETVGSSPVTIARIIDDFVERNWIEYRDGTYSTTMFGELIAEDASRLEQSVDIAYRCRPVAQYCRPEEIDFDPRLLEYTTMSVGPEDTAFDHVDRWAELFRRTDEFQGITGHIPATIMQVFTEEISTGGMDVEGIFPTSLVENIMLDPEKRKAAMEMIDAGARLYQDEHEWDIAIGIYDGDAMSFVGFDTHGSPRFKIESDHDELVTWAIDRFEGARARSTPIEVELPEQ